MTERFVVVPASYVFLMRDGAGGTEVLLQLRQNTGYMDDHWAAARPGTWSAGRLRSTPRIARRPRRSR